MENDKKVKFLLILLLFSSCLAAFCLGTLTYAVATGEMPFDLQVLEQFKDDKPTEQPKYKTAKIPYVERTPDEATLRQLADDFVDRINALEAKEKEVTESKQTMEALIENAETLKSETLSKLEEIKVEKKKSIDDIEAKKKELKDAQDAFDKSKNTLDKGIIESIAGTLSLMQRPESAMIILSDLDVEESARLLRFMTPQKRSEILETMVSLTKLNEKDLSQADQVSFRMKANEIVRELRRLKENIPEEPQP